MPVYYFHLHNDIDARDEAGREFPDLQTAREHARLETRYTFAQTVKDEGRVNLDHHLDIEDEQGRVLATVLFRDAVTIVG